MKNNTMHTRTNTAFATKFLVGEAYKSAMASATALKGEIDRTDKGFFKATFSTSQIAKQFADKFNKDYNATQTNAQNNTNAQKPKASKGKAQAETVTVELNGVKYTVNKAELTEVPSSTKKTTNKPTTNKKSTTSSKKAPNKSKGKTFDYSVIKGKTNSDKNKALHKELVKMGHKDSRTPEYMSIWNARPWAK